MSRPLRVEDAGAIYQLMCRGNARQRIFRDEADDQRLIDGLVTVSRFGWELFGFVLKPNHFYLLLRTPRANLSRVMQYLASHFMLRGAGKGGAANENPLVAHSASGSGTTPVSTAMRSSSGLASQVAW
jgi:REP element-mobilizing transposase RayT